MQPPPPSRAPAPRRSHRQLDQPPRLASCHAGGEESRPPVGEHRRAEHESAAVIAASPWRRRRAARPKNRPQQRVLLVAGIGEHRRAEHEATAVIAASPWRRRRAARPKNQPAACVLPGHRCRRAPPSRTRSRCSHRGQPLAPAESRAPEEPTSSMRVAWSPASASTAEPNTKPPQSSRPALGAGGEPRARRTNQQQQVLPGRRRRRRAPPSRTRSRRSHRGQPLAPAESCAPEEPTSGKTAACRDQEEQLEVMPGRGPKPTWRDAEPRRRRRRWRHRHDCQTCPRSRGATRYSRCRRQRAMLLRKPHSRAFARCRSRCWLGRGPGQHLVTSPRHDCQTCPRSRGATRYSRCRQQRAMLLRKPPSRASARCRSRCQLGPGPGRHLVTSSREKIGKAGVSLRR